MTNHLNDHIFAESVDGNFVVECHAEDASGKFGAEDGLYVEQVDGDFAVGYHSEVASKKSNSEDSLSHTWYDQGRLQDYGRDWVKVRQLIDNTWYDLGQEDNNKFDMVKNLRGDGSGAERTKQKQTDDTEAEVYIWDGVQQSHREVAPPWG